jgi:uncharacterized protein YydD (DUF2326 family)
VEYTVGLKMSNRKRLSGSQYKKLRAKKEAKVEEVQKKIAKIDTFIKKTELKDADEGEKHELEEIETGEQSTDSQLATAAATLETTSTDDGDPPPVSINIQTVLSTVDSASNLEHTLQKPRPFSSIIFDDPATCLDIR